MKIPKNFQKNQKLRSKCMKCMINEREESIPEVETKVWVEKKVGKMKGLREKYLGEKSKRNEKKKKNHAEAIYRKTQDCMSVYML